jgi:hypothetical protein
LFVQLTAQRSWFGEFWAIQYLFMYSSRSYLPNGSRNVPMPEPLYAGTTVPFGRPLVVFGDGTGSYWRPRSQYCVYVPSLMWIVSHVVLVLQTVVATRPTRSQARDRELSSSSRAGAGPQTRSQCRRPRTASREADHRKSQRSKSPR